MPTYPGTSAFYDVVVLEQPSLGTSIAHSLSKTTITEEVESVLLSATLTDSLGAPVSGKTITWDISGPSSDSYTGQTVDGAVSVEIYFNVVGNYTITPSFAGDADYNGSVGNTLSLSVVQRYVETNVVFTPLTTSVFAGDSVVIEVGVSEKLTGAVLSGIQVYLTVNGVNQGVRGTIAGKVSWLVSFPTAGLYTLVAASADASTTDTGIHT